MDVRSGSNFNSTLVSPTWNLNSSSEIQLSVLRLLIILIIVHFTKMYYIENVSLVSLQMKYICRKMGLDDVEGRFVYMYIWIKTTEEVK